MKCPSCGYDDTIHSERCPSCDAPLVEENTNIEDTLIIEESSNETVTPETDVTFSTSVPESAEAPTDTVTPELKAKSGKRRLPLIIGGIVAVLLILAASAFAVISNSPLALLSTGFENSNKAIQQSAPMQLLESTVNGGSINLNADLADVSKNLIGFSINAGADATVYLNAKDRTSALTASISVSSTELLSASLWQSPTDFALGFEPLLSGKSYGLDLAHLEENLKTSPLAEYFNTEALHLIDSDALQQLEKDRNTVKKDFLKVVRKSLNDNADIRKSRESVSLGDLSTPVTDVTISFTKAGAKEFVQDLYDYYKTDATVLSLVEHMDSTYSSVLKGYLDVSDTEVSDAWENLLSRDMPALLEEGLTDEDTLNLHFFVTQSGKQLIGLSVCPNPSTEALLLVGPNLESPKNLEMILTMGGETFAELTYTVTANNQSTYSAVLTAQLDGQTSEDITIDWDKGSGDFLLCCGNYGISGKLLQSDSLTALSFSHNSIPSIGEFLKCLTLTINTSDAMPPIPAYTDVAALSENELNAVFSDITDKLESFVSLLDLF